MPTFVKTDIVDDVFVIEIDNPPVNAISAGVPEAIADALGAAERDAAVRAIVIKGAGRVFIAGADIAALEEAAWNPAAAAIDLHDFLARIEDCPKPVVMAIHGAALGGGLEVAMAGHYRVASRDTQIGQPEVNLGIIPGAEGTQRLPRLVGIGKALDMCVTGRPISAEDAIAAGLVDEIVDGEPTAEAVSFAWRAVGRASHIKTRDRNDRLGTAETNAPLYEDARQLARRVKPRQIAPLKAIDAIEATATLPFLDGCRRERDIFLECLRSDQARSFIHLFFAERALAKRLKKLPETVGNDPELVGSRIMFQCVHEAEFLVQEGATSEQIDRALTEFGMTNGLIVVDDLPGLHPERREQIGKAAKITDIGRREISDQEIVERATYVLVNEGARTLEAGVAVRASDIDVICTRDHGFPAWRGGPMLYADLLGLSLVLERVSAFHKTHGERWRPAPLLVELARSGKTFRELDRSRGD